MFMLKIAVAARCEILDGMEKYFCNAFYTDAFQQAGASLIMAMSYDQSDWFAKQCDALLVPGGNDMDSAYFQEPLHPLAHIYERPIDALDYSLISAFLKAGKPILGICRGLQVLNVYFGGTLQQHFNKEEHAQSDGTQPMHALKLHDHTFMSNLYEEPIFINSYHHQRIAKLADHLQIAATHPDGTIEAFQHDSLPVWAVQWHPERMGKSDRIIPAFIKSCSAR